jgi:NAD(P)-dependent dehydrogenase (short-subunit alcohol dehydrogenase family)
VARRWLITGASRGIGAAIAAAAAARGDRLVLVARGEGVERVAADLASRGVDAHALRVDLTAADGPAEAVAAATERLGGLDVLVNNAAMHRGGRIEKLPDGDFEAVVEANLIAPFRLCREAVKVMDDGSSIVNIGAVVGFRGFPGDAPYGSSKAGLAGLTLVLAIELARRRITVNLVVPGFTETDMTGALDDRARDKILTRIPLRRPAAPAEVAEVVAWVSASPYMTGAIVPVDGGLSAALGGV